MKLGRNLTVAIWLSGALLFPAGFCARAQEPPPDLHMLLNLDLFAGNAGDPDSPPTAQSGSLLDQIRTLAALGYLGNRAAPVEPAENSPPPAGAPAAYPDYQLLPGQGEQP
jgi:hypothetical protein